jgi:hypothetical protein
MAVRLRSRLPVFYKTDSSYAAFVSACKRAGPRNLVAEILDPLRIARDTAPADVQAAIRGFQRRPWYSAAELARLWPLISIGIASKHRGSAPSPASVHKRLIECGLPRLQKWDGSTQFMFNGKPQDFFIVADVWKIAGRRWTQADFDRVMVGE